MSVYRNLLRTCIWLIAVFFASVAPQLASAEALLMPYDDYIDRCMETYGHDQVTKHVCESQYQAIEKKEQDLMAQTESLKQGAWKGDLSDEQVVDQNE
ncbi:hypothetical protein L4D09_20280 [Photobacterium makurazakiensis]|uniref:hypothetical protein n=1 Tax=Photobacterium makurazakiensis TaxID=2910234 RepID=UPI003D0B9CE4